MRVKNRSLESLFVLEVARSRGAKDYDEGSTPFVTSTVLNNGVDRYVEPDPDYDRVFEGPAVAISGLGFATLQTRRFLPKGNGGDSLTILRPREPMSSMQLFAVAVLFNQLHGWRFSYGRKAKRDRLASLEVPWPPPDLRTAIEASSSSLRELDEGLRGELDESVGSAE